jgi:FkbM family methyltransferase
MELTAVADYRPLRDQSGFLLEGLAEDFTVFQPIRDTHVWESHIIALLERIIRPGFLCFDVGANIGAITLPLSRLASEGWVHAFEASPTAYTLLTRNLAANAVTNVTAVNAAIAERSGDTTEIWTSNAVELGCAHLTSSEHGRFGTCEQVKTLALDSYHLGPVDFMKMDIEGAENEALKGASCLLSADRPILLIEYNPTCIEWYSRAASRRALYDTLTAFYPRIEIIGPAGVLEPVTSWEALDRELTAYLYRDLLCTHSSL